MPDGSPFGAVAVDSAACTLCMACAVACPSGALSAGRDTPRLTFIESRCHQCGLCRDACPEDAIRLEPRILCDPAAVDVPAVLREAEPFRCVVCGAPFATQVMVDRMQDKLAGHWMYAGERQLRRLRMCRICRTRDALESKDVNAWNR
jgi:ferredoxin